MIFSYFFYLFEFSRLEGLIFLLFIFVLLLTWIRIFFIQVFLNRFYSMGIFLFIVIGLNSLICFSFNLFFLVVILLVVSFLSFCLVLYGYGVSIEVCFIIPFKLLADLSLMLYFGCSVFLVGYVEVGVLEFGRGFVYVDLFLFISFCVYSLCGVFGFWLYWAMDGSYFISSYLHSVGFIMIGIVLFFKIYYLGLLWGDCVDEFLGLYYYLVLIFYFNFLLFIVFFICVRRGKKGYGYFSCSSVCFVFLVLIYSPYVGLIYFCLSSFLKIFFFEFMGMLGKRVLNKRFVYQGFVYFSFVSCMSFVVYGFSLYIYFYFDLYNESLFHVKVLCGMGMGDLFKCALYLKCFSLIIFLVRLIGGVLNFSFFLDLFIEIGFGSIFFMFLFDLVYVFFVYFFVVYVLLLDFYLFGVMFFLGVLISLCYGIYFRGFRIVDLEVGVRMILRMVFNWVVSYECDCCSFWFRCFMVHNKGRMGILSFVGEGVLVGVFSFFIFSFTFLL